MFRSPANRIFKSAAVLAAVLSACTLASGFVSALGPDFFAWLEIGRADPDFFSYEAKHDPPGKLRRVGLFFSIVDGVNTLSASTMRASSEWGSPHLSGMRHGQPYPAIVTMMRHGPGAGEPACAHPARTKPRRLTAFPAGGALYRQALRRRRSGTGRPDLDASAPPALTRARLRTSLCHPA